MSDIERAATAVAMDPRYQNHEHISASMSRIGGSQQCLKMALKLAGGFDLSLTADEEARFVTIIMVAIAAGIDIATEMDIQRRQAQLSAAVQ